MTNKGLVYFLWLLIALLSYSLYQSEEDNRRLFKIANDLKDQMEDQNRLIRTQQLYLEYFNYKDSLKPQTSPLHGPL